MTDDFAKNTKTLVSILRAGLVETCLEFELSTWSHLGVIKYLHKDNFGEPPNYHFYVRCLASFSKKHLT